jgi:hypothetical protein
MLSGSNMIKIEQIKELYIGLTTLWNYSSSFNITIYEGGLESYFHKFISQIMHKSGILHIQDCHHQYAILFVPSWMNRIPFE